MAREALFAGAAVVVLAASVLAAALVPGALAEPSADRADARLTIAETTLEADTVTGETATLGVQTHLRHAGGPAENVTVVYRARDTDTGLIETTVRRDLGVVSTDGEQTVSGTLTVERQGGYEIETLVYRGDRRVEQGRTSVSGVGTLQPAYATSTTTFHRFERVGNLPAIQYAIADVQDGGVTLDVSTFLTNEGDAPADDLRVVVQARQADSNVVADRAEIDVGAIRPGRTVAPSTTLTVPDEYNYYLDAVLYRDGVVVGTAQSAANLDPAETLSANETRREVGLQVEDFERTDGTGDRPPTPTPVADTAQGPGFGLPAALAAIVLFAVVGLIRRWST